MDWRRKWYKDGPTYCEWIKDEFINRSKRLSKSQIRYAIKKICKIQDWPYMTVSIKENKPTECRYDYHCNDIVYYNAVCIPDEKFVFYGEGMISTTVIHELAHYNGGYTLRHGKHHYEKMQELFRLHF